MSVLITTAVWTKKGKQGICFTHRTSITFTCLSKHKHQRIISNVTAVSHNFEQHDLWAFALVQLLCTVAWRWTWNTMNRREMQRTEGGIPNVQNQRRGLHDAIIKLSLNWMLCKLGTNQDVSIMQLQSSPLSPPTTHSRRDARSLPATRWPQRLPAVCRLPAVRCPPRTLAATPARRARGCSIQPAARPASPAVCLSGCWEILPSRVG